MWKIKINGGCWNNQVQNSFAGKHVDRRAENEIDNAIRKERDELNIFCLDSLCERMTKEKFRGNDLAQMKGGSSWLTARPLKEEGLVLNKREFYGALAIRY